MQPKNFIMIGSGNVATHLATALHRAGRVCHGVYSATPEHAKKLADRLNAPCLGSLADVFAKKEADIVITSVSDDALPGIGEAIPEAYNTLIVHTSGTTPMTVLERAKHAGVLYPLQTFTANSRIDLPQVPFFIEGTSEGTYVKLERLLGEIGVTDPKRVDSPTRARIHLAAVFVCNFVNHMIACGQTIMEEAELDVLLLKPLMMETFQKSMYQRAKDIQTGPARRNDRLTIRRHLQALDERPALQDLYASVTESIIRMYHPEKEDNDE